MRAGTDMDKSFKRQIFPWFLFVSFLLAVSGCAAQKPIPSGFLGDYSSFTQEESDGVEGLYCQKHPKKDLGQYSRFIVDPVIIHLRPEVEVDEYKVTAEELKELADCFRNEVVAVLKDGYAVVKKPGVGGVIRLRIAITDVEPNTPFLNVHWVTSLPGMGLGGASMEAEFIDTQSGERIFAFIDSRKGKRYKKIKGLTRWGHSKDIFKQWANLIRERIDCHHGK